MANNDKFNKDIPPESPDKHIDKALENIASIRKEMLLMQQDDMIFGMSGYHSPSMKRVHPLKLIEMLNKEEEKKFKRNGKD